MRIPKSLICSESMWQIVFVSFKQIKILKVTMKLPKKVSVNRKYAFH